VAVGANRGIFAPAKLSKYCRLAFEYPVSTDDTASFAGAVKDFSDDHKIELIIPITEWTTLPLSRHAQLLASGCPVALPSREALELASDKYRTVELARSLGVAVPATWLITSPQEIESLPQMAFPVVVKDRCSVRWVANKTVFGSVAYAYSREDLARKIEDRLQVAGDVLVQEFVHGTGIGFSCFSVDGEMRIPFQWERVRETDPRGSGSSARKSTPLDPSTTESSASLIKRAGFEGIAMVEFKRETGSGRSVLMEINGRPWGSIQLAIASGIDYPRYLAEWWLTKAKPPRVLAFKTDITCRRMAGELTHLENLRRGTPPGWPIQYPSFWTSLVKVAIPWYPGLRYDDIAFADPRPGGAEIANWFRLRLQKYLNKS
jgi:predicted ATP-grasp superfamily ATP-dependent carboligase